MYTQELTAQETHMLRDARANKTKFNIVISDFSDIIQGVGYNEFSDFVGAVVETIDIHTTERNALIRIMCRHAGEIDVLAQTLDDLEKLRVKLIAESDENK